MIHTRRFEQLIAGVFCSTEFFLIILFPTLNSYFMIICVKQIFHQTAKF